MSYRTYYSLTIEPAEKEKEIIATLREENEDARYALSESGGCETDSSWYKHEEELIEFSKKFPDVLFELHGEGEEHDDLWNKYFKNGKMQICAAEIIYPPFNESKLREVTHTSLD